MFEPAKPLLLALVILAGCSVNPVTGDREIVLMSGSEEVQMGEQNYVPTQQSQGGQYDVDPELTRYVTSVGDKLAAVSDNPLPYEFVVLNNSVPNAWALPGGKIAVNRGLLTELGSEAELAAVLGHEIVHAAARHTAQQMTRGMWMQGLVVATAVVTSDSDYGNMAVGSAGAAAQLATMKYGRSAELESDKYGMRYMSKVGYDPEGAVALQRTFLRLSEGNQQDWISGLFSSHPPSEERVQANIKTASRLPPGGDLGVARYQAAMQKTNAAKPAYDAYDDGRKALADEDVDKALVAANAALDLFPAEANFHALRGDVRLIQDEYDMAVTNYNRAIERRGTFFYYYLQRGIAKNELGQADSAAADLERSLRILPTAPAHFILGEISADKGDTTKAIEHYKVVAESGGDIGDAASARLVQLDLPANPGAYIASACGDDGNGKIGISVRNDTKVAIQDVSVRITYVDSGGTQRSATQDFSGQVEPGKIESTVTGMTFLAGSRCVAEVNNARIVD